MSIIYTDDKAKPLRTKLTQRNNKLETNLATQHQQQDHPHSISPIKATNNNNNNNNVNDIYANTDLTTLNSTGYRIQQHQTNHNRSGNLSNQRNNQIQFSPAMLGNNNNNNNNNNIDLDRMSLGSISAPIDDLPHKSRRTSTFDQTSHTQRRQSFLRKHWQQHSDVPFVIGADAATPSDGTCEKILTVIAWILLIIFFPFSLFFCMKVVQEYE